MRNGRKKRMALILMLLVLVLAVPTAAAEPKLSKASVTLTKGKTKKITVKNSKLVYTWKSSNKAVARVSKGKITAVKAGKATITATSKDKSVKLSCKVTVKPAAVKSVKLGSSSISLTAGKSKKLKVQINPSNADNPAVTWKSSNKKVAKVSSAGKVTAVKAGTATITCTSKADPTKKATCKVTVKAAASTVSAKKMSISKTSLSLIKGKNAVLEINGAPSSSAPKFLWTSSNRAIATVTNATATGITVNGIAVGETTINVKSLDGSFSASCKVSVSKKAASTSGTSAGNNAKKFLSLLEKYSKQVQTDAANGKKWTYANSAPKTFAEAAAGKRTCNCALLPRWGLREMGILTNGNFWDGGYSEGDGTDAWVFTKGKEASIRAQLEPYCEILYPNKTASQLEKEGNLKPGDICGWGGLRHTSVYAGNGKWYDAGRGMNYQGGFVSFGPTESSYWMGEVVTGLIRWK